MNDLTQLNFDYNALPVATALEVRAAAERIKVRMKRTVEDIVEIGKELTAVKERLEHGQFLPWLKAEFEMDARTAQQMMAVYDRFGKYEKISYFKPSILYALAAASNFMSVAARFGDKLPIIGNFKPTVLYALAAPVIVCSDQETERQANPAGKTFPIAKLSPSRRNYPAKAGDCAAIMLCMRSSPSSTGLC